MAGSAHAPPVVIDPWAPALFNGPHDGTWVFKKAIDWLLGVWYPLFPGSPSVVLPAGNNFLWRTHSHHELPAGARTSFSWRLVPGQRSNAECGGNILDGSFRRA